VLHMRIADPQKEYRTKARGSMAAGVECDLCEEVVTEWEWVDKGWSLACRPCLDKIRAQAVKEKDAFGTELSNKKAQITELLRHQNVLHKEIARLRPAVESAMLWFKEHGKPELSWQYEAALRRAPAGNAGTGTTSRDIPRRIRIDRMAPAERAIRDAKLAVEALGADVHRLHLFAHHGSIPILKSVREGVPHSSQNLAPDRFSCWHRRHCILRPPSGSESGTCRTGGESLVWRTGRGQGAR